jgi:hypothetical protein
VFLSSPISHLYELHLARFEMERVIWRCLGLSSLGHLVWVRVHKFVTHRGLPPSRRFLFRDLSWKLWREVICWCYSVFFSLDYLYWRCICAMSSPYSCTISIHWHECVLCIPGHYFGPGWVGLGQEKAWLNILRLRPGLARPNCRATFSSPGPARRAKKPSGHRAEPSINSRFFQPRPVTPIG